MRITGWMSPAASGKKLAGLDHLRALAIALVFLYHYRLFDHPEWINSMGEFGWTGVDLFFVLSGFLIAGQLFNSLQKKQRIPWQEFYIKRFFRILPAYWLILACYFLIPGFKERQGLSPLWKFLTFTQNFGLDLRQTRAFTHAWSLCIEEQFYLFLPFILLLFIRLKLFRYLLYLVPVILATGFIVRWYNWHHFVEPIQGENGSYAIWYTYIYYPTYARLEGLLTGVCLAALFQFKPVWREKLTSHGSKWLVLALLILTGAYFLCEEPSSLNASLFGFFTVSIGYGAMLIASVSPSCFLYKHSTWITSWLATLSFAVYLSHKAVVHLTQDLFGSWGVDRNGSLMFFICTITCMAAGLLLHLIIEKPCLRLRNRVLSKIALHTSSATPATGHGV